MLLYKLSKEINVFFSLLSLCPGCFLPFLSLMLVKSTSIRPLLSHPYVPHTSRPAISAKRTCCPERMLHQSVPPRAKMSQSQTLNQPDPNQLCSWWFEEKNKQKTKSANTRIWWIVTIKRTLS